mgnify:CR=1 FL=1
MVKNKDLFSVEGKRILLTGVSQGNGYAIAKGFLDAGSRVIGIDKSICKLKHKNFSFVQANLLVRDEFSKIHNKIESMKSLDVIINNAGISLDKSTLEKEDYWNRWIIKICINQRKTSRGYPTYT